MAGDYLDSLIGLWFGAPLRGCSVADPWAADGGYLVVLIAGLMCWRRLRHFRTANAIRMLLAAAVLSPAMVSAQPASTMDPWAILNETCSMLSESPPLANGWPTHCARVTGSTDRCSSLEGHPSHSRVGLRVRFSLADRPQRDLPWAYLGTEDEEAWMEPPIVGLLPAAAFAGDPITGRWLSPTVWGLPMAGRHLYRLPATEVTVTVGPAEIPADGCALERVVELDGPVDAVPPVSEASTHVVWPWESTTSVDLDMGLLDDFGSWMCPM